MNRKSVILISALSFGWLIVMSGLSSLLPYLAAIGVLTFLAITFYRGRQGRTSTHVGATDYASGDTTLPLVAQLQSHFARNQSQRLQNALAHLPAWPISARIQAAAQELLALKQSIYRAQREGLPAPMFQRYLDNTTQAADTVWQLASKLDAISQNQVAYVVVEGTLEREDQRLQRLQRLIKETHEGIAILLAEGIQSETLQTVEQDLSALHQAIRILQTKSN